MATVSRRGVLLGTGGVVLLAGAGYGGSLAVCARMELAAHLPLERLDVALAGMPDPARIARAWRARVGRSETEKAFRADPGLLDALATECPETRRALFRARFHADFAAGKVVLADRFVVSRAECLAAALSPIA